MHLDNRGSPFLITLSFGLLLTVGLVASVEYMNDSDAKNSSGDNGDDRNCSETNIIIGTRTYTKGTECNDIIIGCPITPEGTGCSSGDTLRGLERHDILHGTVGDDTLYGDEGNDELSGSDGNDRLYGGPNDDILMASFGGDFLVGDKGRDELYGGPGDDVLIGGPGPDYFDCGDGYDIMIDFNPANGDTHADNCEVVLSNLGSKEILTQGEVMKSIEALGIGSQKHPIDLEDIGETIN
ncbi:MAG: calcium-binding protein [Nitrososphaeraceae archaeon]